MADETKKPVKRLTKAEKLEKLNAKKKALEAQIQRLEAADKEKARKADARKKILLGGFVLSLVEKDPTAKAILEKCIASLKKDSDKSLFTE